MVNLDKLETINRIKALSKEQGTSLTFMYKKIGLPSGFLRDYKDGKTSLTEERLFAIANFLNTTPEYLNGKTDIKEKAAPVSGNDFSLDEIEFLKAVDLLNPAMQRAMVALSALDQETLERIADLAESLAKSKER